MSLHQSHAVDERGANYNGRIPDLHALCLAGGEAPSLGHWIAHYRGLGIEQIHVHMHLNAKDDPNRHAIEETCRRMNCPIAQTHISSWYEAKHRAFNEFRAGFPADWFVVADCDELQDYPMSVLEAVELCGRNGYDFVRGCFIDRIGPEGTLPAIDESLPIGPQFPIGAWFSYPVLGAYPLNVTMAKGAVSLDTGQHGAKNGLACPAKELFVPVHHFKWVAGIRERLIQRIAYLRSNNHPHWRESARFLEYMEATGGTINLDDPAFAAAECTQGYPRFEELKQMLLPQIDESFRDS